MGAEEGLGAESVASSAEKKALEEKLGQSTTKYLEGSPFNPSTTAETSVRPTLPLRESFADEYVTGTSSGSSGSEGLLRPTNPTALKESEVAGETLADDSAATSEKEPLFDTPVETNSMINAD